MMGFYVAGLSGFGRDVRPTDEQRQRLQQAIYRYRRAREQYEIAIYEGESADTDEEYRTCDAALQALAETRAEIVLELAKTLAEEIRNG